MKIPENVKFFSLEKAIIKEDASYCTPKDCVLGFLQEMEKEEIKPKRVIICYAHEEDGSVSYRAAGGSRAELIGTLELAKNIILNN